MKLKRLQHNDLDTAPEGLLDLCEMLHVEYDYPSEWDGNYFRTYMMALLGQGMGYFSMLTDEDDEPVAICGGVLAPDPYAGGAPKAYEMFWYVHPEHRRGGAGKMVMDDWEAWAKERGAHMITMCHLTDMNPEIARVYEKRGYRPFEVHFWKELDQ